MEFLKECAAKQKWSWQMDNPFYIEKGENGIGASTHAIAGHIKGEMSMLINISDVQISFSLFYNCINKLSYQFIEPDKIKVHNTVWKVRCPIVLCLTVQCGRINKSSELKKYMICLSELWIKTKLVISNTSSVRLQAFKQITQGGKKKVTSRIKT